MALLHLGQSQRLLLLLFEVAEQDVIRIMINIIRSAKPILRDSFMKK
jgi:hypothetical protein